MISPWRVEAGGSSGPGALGSWREHHEAACPTLPTGGSNHSWDFYNTSAWIGIAPSDQPVPTPAPPAVCGTTDQAGGLWSPLGISDQRERLESEGPAPEGASPACHPQPADSSRRHSPAELKASPRPPLLSLHPQLLIPRGPQSNSAPWVPFTEFPVDV